MAMLALFVGAMAQADATSTTAAAKGMPLTLAVCTGAANQAFHLASVNPYVEAAAVSGMGFCFDIEGYGTAAGSAVRAWPCGLDSKVNEYWKLDPAAGTVSSLQPETPLCFGIAGAGATAALAKCTSAAAQFDVATVTDKKNGTLVHTATKLCVTMSGAVPQMPPPAPPPPPYPPKNKCPGAQPKPRPPGPAPTGSHPCDIYDSAGGTPCVAAHSMVRALYAKYDGPLYLVRRASDMTTKSIGLLAAGGFADAAQQDTFCKGTDCEVRTIFDQSGRGNHLRTGFPGRHSPVDNGVNATKHPITISGHSVYGAWFDEGMGYRNDNTSGIAVGQDPESMYAVFGGGHYDDQCCFDYGNAENKVGASRFDAAGTMEAIYFGSCTSWWAPEAKAKIPKDWHGPYVMADLEAGMYAGNSSFNPANSPMNDTDFVTAMLKGHICEFSLKAGDAQAGKLMAKYDGQRNLQHDSRSWNPMRKQGGLILGTGGDNSDRALGIFYEGAMTTGYTTAATDDAIQASIVAAGYGK